MAVLSIYARENEHGDTPASYLSKNLRQAGSDYGLLARSLRFQWNRWGPFTAADAKRLGTVVTRISLSLRPLER
jgi:hypothetical protein